MPKLINHHKVYGFCNDDYVILYGKIIKTSAVRNSEFPFFFPK
jgi:hypothetical protein